MMKFRSFLQFAPDPWDTGDDLLDDPLAAALKQEEEEKQYETPEETNEFEEQPPEDSEGWVITFADLLSNLLLFFIMMYAISSIDDGKFNLLAQALNKDIKEVQQQINQEVINETKAQTTSDNAEILRQVQSLLQRVNPTVLEADKQTAQALEDAQERLAEMFYVVPGREKQVPVVELILGGARHYDSLSSAPSARGADALRKLALELKPHEKRLVISVEGHVDPAEDQRLSRGASGKVASWELSTRRAAAVVEILRQEGLEPQKFHVTGLADREPQERTEEGLSKLPENDRRVRIQILRVGEMSDSRQH